MSVMILTNNPRLEKEKPEDIPCLMLESHDEVIQKTGEMIRQGWRLSADPAAGYSKHYNPYHTIFLEKEEAMDEDDMKIQKRLMRVLVEKLSALPRKPAEDRDEIRRDYMDLDYELAISTLRELKRHVSWKIMW